MPNIIEQQDLLKNLSDARLATLLQNPVADIPPFLVAAEAHRRQVLSQQFAGSENKESVVDTLTKQIAKVPQNIQSPMQTPPMVPPTPQMQGVAALQQQQAIQDIAQQAQPQQQMRHGGMVQRYQDRGLVQPTVSNLASSITGMTKEQYAAEQRRKAAPPGSRARYLLDNPVVPKTEAQLAQEELYAATEGPLSGFYSPESVYEAAQAVTNADKKSAASTAPGMTAEENLKEVEAQRRKLPVDAEPLSDKAPPPPEPGETKDEYRARIEALYADRGTSSWERAQKWFSMAEKFFDPSLTTGQSIAAAGSAFAGSAGEQARADRELAIAREKALLEYDISERDRLRSIEADRAQREFETQQKLEERRTVTASAVMSFIDSQITALSKEMSDIDESFLTPEEKAKKKALIQEQIDRYKGQGEMLMRQSGYKSALTVADLEKMAAGNQ